MWDVTQPWTELVRWGGRMQLGASEYQAVWSGIYHTAWSYLRPMYVLTFALYYLKRQFLSAGEELWQAAACGFGFVFFWLLCPLVVSPSTEYDGAHPFPHLWASTGACPAVQRWKSCES